jgi:hypothetical protein
MVQYTIEIVAGQPIILDSDAETTDTRALKKATLDYLMAVGKEDVSTQVAFLRMVGSNLRSLRKKNLDDEFKKDLSEIVTQLMSEPAIELLKDDSMAWSRYVKTGQGKDRTAINQEKLKYAEGLTLGDLLKKDVYNDLIGWTVLKFGRDLEKLPRFGFDAFLREEKILPYDAEVYRVPLRLVMSYPQSKKKKFVELLKAYDEIKKKNKKAAEAYITETIIPMLTFSYSYSTKEENAVVIHPQDKNTFELLKDAKTDAIRKMGVRSGQWRIKSVEPSFTDYSEREFPMPIPTEAVEKLDFVEIVGNAMQTLLQKGQYEFILGKEIIADAIEDFINDDLKKEIFRRNRNTQTEINTIVFGHYKLKVKQGEGIPAKRDENDKPIKRTPEEVREDLISTLKKATIKVQYTFDVMAEFDFSPYSKEGEKVNELMRDVLSEFRANLISLEKRGIELKEV